MTASADLLNVKQQADAYGVAVRAGTITPQRDDEDHFRKKAGLPKMGKEAASAWDDDGGVRRPITLQSGDAFAATQDQVTADGSTDPGATDPGSGNP